MPDLWKLIKPSIYASGIDITQAFTYYNTQGLPTAFWLPDIIFPDANSLVVTNQYVRLWANGQIRQMQHIVLTLSASTMNYAKYPCDVQTITIDFFSFAMPTNQFQFTLIPQLPGLVSKPADIMYPLGSKTPSFAENPVWTFVSMTYGYTSWQLSEGNWPRPFGYVTFVIARKSTGVIIRLCVPILIIMVLCGFSYWSSASDRVAINVTGLLAIAAVYVGVVGAIPMVGYMTNLDCYILSMFGILFVNILCHIIVVRLNVESKDDKWPLRKLFVRILEFFGRLFMIPSIVISFIIWFYNGLSISLIVLLIISITTIDLIVCLRYGKHLSKTRMEAQAILELKKSKNVDSLTYPEKQFLKMCDKLFNKFEISNANDNNKEIELHAMENGNGDGNVNIIKNPLI